MKFNAGRKINLSNIDPIFQFEMEELSVHDCESPEEATQKLDLWVRERVLYYKELTIKLKADRATPPPNVPVMPPPRSTTAPTPMPTYTRPSPAAAPQGPPAEFA